jgi:hypothetical protein
LLSTSGLLIERLLILFMKKVLCFTSSFKRLKFARSCIRDISCQTYPNLDHGVNITFEQNQGCDGFELMFDDIPLERTHIVYSCNKDQHANHMAAISAVPCFLDYDYFVKIDDDDIYKKDYVKNIVDFFDANECDICSSRTNLQLNGGKIKRISRSNLGNNPIGSDFNMPPTFAFNNRALQCIIDADLSDGWEDLLWRRVWVDAGLRHLTISNEKSFIWHIHGNNVSTHSLLEHGGVSLRQWRDVILKRYSEIGGFQSILEKIWCYKGSMIVFDFLVEKNKIAFDVAFDGDGRGVTVFVFPRGADIKIMYKSMELLVARDRKHVLSTFDPNDVNFVDSLVSEIDGFLSYFLSPRQEGISVS